MDYLSGLVFGELGMEALNRCNGFGGSIHEAGVLDFIALLGLVVFFALLWLQL